MAKRDFSTADFAGLTEANGRTLAVEMLEKYRRAKLGPLCIEARYRNGRAQRDILGSYLSAMRAAGNASVERGFMAVLNDFLGHELSGASVEPCFYKELTESDISRAFTPEERGESEADPRFVRGHLRLVHSRGR